MLRTPNLLPFRLWWLAQVKADVNVRKILRWTISLSLSSFVMSSTFSLYENFFACLVDIGQSVFVTFGKITQDTFSLLRDKDGKLYFEFGRFYENKIHLDDFDEVN